MQEQITTVGAIATGIFLQSKSLQTDRMVC